MKIKEITGEDFEQMCFDIHTYGQLKYSKMVDRSQTSISQIVNKKRKASQWMLSKMIREINQLKKTDI